MSDCSENLIRFLGEAMAGMKPETLARVQVYKEPIDFKALNLGV